MYGLKKENFLFWFEAGFLHFFSLKNLQKLYKWGVTICQKFVRCKVREIKIEKRIYRKFTFKVSPSVKKLSV